MSYQFHRSTTFVHEAAENKKPSNIIPAKDSKKCINCTYNMWIVRTIMPFTVCILFGGPQVRRLCRCKRRTHICDLIHITMADSKVESVQTFGRKVFYCFNVINSLSPSSHHLFSSSCNVFRKPPPLLPSSRRALVWSRSTVLPSVFSSPRSSDWRPTSLCFFLETTSSPT